MTIFRQRPPPMQHPITPYMPPFPPMMNSFFSPPTTNPFASMLAMGFATPTPTTNTSSAALSPQLIATLEHPTSKLPPAPIPLNIEDFEDVEFWDKGRWDVWVEEEKELGGFTPVRGEGKNSSWMENAHGIRVDVGRQTQIIAVARSTWTTLKNCGFSLTPLKQMDTLIISYFRRRLEAEFEELCFCNNHWKTDALWMENFSSWQRDGKIRPSKAGKVSAPRHDPTIHLQICFHTVKTSPIREKTVRSSLRVPVTF